jgi:hypothetical protein
MERKWRPSGEWITAMSEGNGVRPACVRNGARCGCGGLLAAAAASLVFIESPVVVLTRGDDNKTFWEETRTVTVNAHGAMIVLGVEVSLGQLLTVAI